MLDTFQVVRHFTRLSVTTRRARHIVIVPSLKDNELRLLWTVHFSHLKAISQHGQCSFGFLWPEASEWLPWKTRWHKVLLNCGEVISRSWLKMVSCSTKAPGFEGSDDVRRAAVHQTRTWMRTCLWGSMIHKKPPTSRQGMRISHVTVLHKVAYLAVLLQGSHGIC